MDARKEGTITLLDLLDREKICFSRMPYHGADARGMIERMGADLQFIVDDAERFSVVVTPERGGAVPYRIYPNGPVRAAEYTGAFAIESGTPVFAGFFSLHNYGHHPARKTPLFAGPNGWTIARSPRLEAVVRSAGVCTAIYAVE